MRRVNYFLTHESLFSKQVLKKLAANEAHETLAVADAKLGNIIREKMDITCVANSSIQELMR